MPGSGLGLSPIVPRAKLVGDLGREWASPLHLAAAGSRCLGAGHCLLNRRGRGRPGELPSPLMGKGGREPS